MPPMGSLASMGTLPTWEKVVTYLLEPPDFGNLRDGCEPSQLPLLNQTFRILPLCFEPTQGCQKCERSHRDARWIGGLSHQSSNLSCCCYSLQKVVVHACSNTAFEQHKVVNYPANLQTTWTILTKGVQDNLGHMQINKQGTLSCRNVLLLHERHWHSHDRGSVAS